MKKVFATLAATVMLGAVCTGFAACGENDPLNIDTEKVKSEIVTQEEWESAFSMEAYENVKFVMTVDYKGEYQGETSWQLTKYSYVWADGKGYSKVELSDSTNGDHGVVDEHYYKNAADHVEDDGIPTEVIAEFNDDLHDRFGQYEYSEEKGGYVYIGEESKYFQFKDYVIKFTDKKVRVMELIQVGESEESREEMNITYVFTYGGQSVTLPTE